LTKYAERDNISLLLLHHIILHTERKARW